MSEIKVGVSSCLTGEKVRNDGGHKHDRYITDTLGAFFSFVRVCPEMESGMPVPRDAMRLAGEIDSPQLITINNGTDLTEKMTSFCNSRLDDLEKAELCGFIFKKNSPSCGLHRVKVYSQSGRMPATKGIGLFAAALTKKFPLLPVEEEGRLYDPALRENFIERVFCYHRWKEFISSDASLGGLVEFHARHKFLLLSHSPQILKELGQLVAGAKKQPLQQLLQSYLETMMKALCLHATPARQVNTLHHIMGFFKKQLEAWEKQELLDIIESYRQHLVPLVVPVTLLNHYIRKYRHAYLLQQVYLSPHPDELMLRNHS